MSDHTIADAVVTSMKVHKRKPADFYPTPPDVTLALLKWLNLNGDELIWEPACGDGAMSKAMIKEGFAVISTDLREDAGFGIGGSDFLNQQMELDVDWIITNPPFNLAAKFIEHALTITPNVAMLLKATYWNAKGREALFRKHPPTYILPLTWRPAFLEEERGSSPLMDVMWVVWQENSDGFTRFEPILRPYIKRMATNFQITSDEPKSEVLHNYLRLLGFNLP